jgi:hypothetical protein
MPAVVFTGFLTLSTGLGMSIIASPEVDAGERPVEIRRKGENYLLYCGGQSYYIKGVGGIRFIEKAAAAGAFSVRTRGPQNAGKILDRAQSFGMTAMVGIWLSHAPSDYLRSDYKNRKIAGVRALIDAAAYAGPYLITEWEVDGHWEVKHTSWARPIEPTSAVKAEDYHRRYQEDILANRDRCIGSYVFLWGQKQERTPTWYGMFIRDMPEVGLEAASCPAVDVMAYNWSGLWPPNRAPKVTAMTINGFTAYHDIALTPGAYRLFVDVFDGNGHVGTANVHFQVDSHRIPTDAGSTTALKKIRIPII